MAPAETGFVTPARSVVAAPVPSFATTFDPTADMSASVCFAASLSVTTLVTGPSVATFPALKIVPLSRTSTAAWPPVPEGATVAIIRSPKKVKGFQIPGPK